MFPCSTVLMLLGLAKASGIPGSVMVPMGRHSPSGIGAQEGT